MTNRREKFRAGLHSLYLPRYDLLCERLTEEWQPYSGLRSVEQQQALYAQGRTTPGAIVTDSHPGESAHNYGCASDWVRFDDKGRPLWLKRSDPTWAIYVGAVKSIPGLKAGQDFGDTDHNELKLSCHWSDVFKAFEQGGLEAAHEQIRLHAIL